MNDEATAHRQVLVLSSALGPFIQLISSAPDTVHRTVLVHPREPLADGVHEDLFGIDHDQVQEDRLHVLALQRATARRAFRGARLEQRVDAARTESVAAEKDLEVSRMTVARAYLTVYVG